MANLSIKNLSKSYGTLQILQGIDLTIEPGELIVVVGPSGCGKSTLLRTVAGLEEVGSGEIYIEDRLVNQLEPRDRNIAMVFQNYALYPHMTVYQNMAYGLQRRKLKKADIDARVTKTAAVLGLNELLGRKPKELSGGQRQRVAMGRAIVRKPKLFLFDEPLSNLDAKLRGQMRLEIRKLQRDFKITSLYVTHDQVEAMTLADRLVVMNQGKVEQIGKPMDVYQHPATKFVAGFLGAPPMNFLNAKLSADGLAVALPGGAQLPLAQQNLVNQGQLNQGSLNQAGRAITLGLRPENIISSMQAGASKTEVDPFSLNVELVEALGAEKLVYGRFPGDEQTLTVRVPNKLNPLPGDSLTLGVMPDSLHLFDPIDGTRL